MERDERMVIVSNKGVVLGKLKELLDGELVEKIETRMIDRSKSELPSRVTILDHKEKNLDLVFELIERTLMGYETALLVNKESYPMHIYIELDTNRKAVDEFVYEYEQSIFCIKSDILEGNNLKYKLFLYKHALNVDRYEYTLEGDEIL